MHYLSPPSSISLYSEPTVELEFCSVDPGNRTGWAVWHDGHLISCGLHTRESMIARWAWPEPLHGVIEEPQAYVGRRSKGRMQDIVELARYVGQIQTKFKTTTLVKPAQWKGNLPKAICKARCKAALTRDELACVDTEDHNVWDAIGLGLFYLGRFRLKKGQRNV